jgi:hypothetical protein
MRRLHRFGHWLERQQWWLSLADGIERRVLTPPWERRERPIAALCAARARIVGDQRSADLPLLREIDWCIWAMGGDRATLAHQACRPSGPDRQGPAARL